MFGDLRDDHNLYQLFGVGALAHRGLPSLHRGLLRGSFPAPHHHDPNETLPNFQILGHGGCTWLKSVCTLILSWCHSSTHVPSRSKCWRSLFCQHVCLPNSSMRRWRLCTFLLTVRRSPSAPRNIQIMLVSCSAVLLHNASRVPVCLLRLYVLCECGQGPTASFQWKESFDRE